MDDTFKNMVKQIFQIDAFTEQCYINGFATKCICSSTQHDMLFTDAGLQDGVNFYLDVELDTLDRMPAENDKVIFRDNTYKIASTVIDSANTSMKIYLIALSKGSK